MKGMQVALFNLEHQETGTVEVPARVFARPFNADLVHQALTAQEANARIPSAHAKTRSEVRGGGRKPWRQKGTGRARHGSIRSPLWKGGGVTFGPRREKVFAKKINRKMRQGAVLGVLSRKLKEGKIFFVRDMSPLRGKTRALPLALSKFFAHLRPSGRERILLITPQKDLALERASRNIKRVAVLRADSLNVRDLLLAKWILIEAPSVDVIEKTYALV